MGEPAVNIGLNEPLVDHYIANRLPSRFNWPSIESITKMEYEQSNISDALLDVHLGKGCDHLLAAASINNGKFTQCSYAELTSRVNRVANVLVHQLGVVPGNRILLRSTNQLMLLVSWLATVRVGAVAVTTMPLMRRRELADISKKSRIQFAICDANIADDLLACRTALRSEDKQLLQNIIFFNDDSANGLEARAHVESDQFSSYKAPIEHPLLVAFTSGTTGTSKGAVHFHQDMQSACNIFPKFRLNLSRNDRCLSTSSIGFTYGLGGALCFPLYMGASTILLDQVTVHKVAEIIEICRPSILFSVPSFYRKWINTKSAIELQSVRACVSAGEALSTATRDAWKVRTGIEMIDGLGSTELLHVFLATDPHRHRPGSIGLALPGYRIAILDANDGPVSNGASGHLAVCGPTGCRYLDDAARQKDYVHGQWNITGDIGWVDDDGYFYYQGRSDDLIKSSGYAISGIEIENVLLEHPLVSECAVVGVEDEERGQLVKAYIVLKGDASGDDAITIKLQEFVRSNLSHYKCPRVIEYRDCLPRNEAGKLQRFLLREQGQISDESQSKSTLISPPHS